MNITLKGRSIIVTGASSGIGSAIAKTACEAGANVMLHGTRVEVLAARAKELGSRARWVAADLKEEGAAETIVSATVDAFGKVDGLVNNAGIFPHSTIETDMLSQFDDVFYVNVRAPLMLAQAVARDCRQRNSTASIVNIGSINAHCGANFLLIYSMSKGALMTMTRNLGDALCEDGIRVNQLNVGWVLTEGERAVQNNLGMPDNWMENVNKAAAPRGSIMNPEEIATHAVFWLSDASAPVSGSVYEVEQYPVIGRQRAAG